jgi:PEP-CTERM motif
MKVLLAALALLLIAGASKADSIWSYQGNELSGCNCALTGSVTLAGSPVDTNFAFQSFTPVTFDFSVNGFDFTPANSSAQFLLTFTNGQLTFWHIYAQAGDDSIISYSFDIVEATDGFTVSGLLGGEEGNRGTWTESVASPEPGTLVLVGVGLVGLLARKRSQVRRKQVPEADWEPLA